MFSTISWVVNLRWQVSHFRLRRMETPPRVLRELITLVCSDEQYGQSITSSKVRHKIPIADKFRVNW